MFGTLLLTSTSNAQLLINDTTNLVVNKIAQKTIILTALATNAGTITIRDSISGNEFSLLAGETLSFTTYSSGGLEFPLSSIEDLQYRVSAATQTLKYSII